MSRSTDYWTKRFKDKLRSVIESDIQNLVGNYIGLYTKDPNTGKYVEVIGKGYERKLYEFGEDVIFNEAAESWGTVEAFGLFGSDGKVIDAWPVHVPKVVGKDETARLSIEIKELD